MTTAIDDEWAANAAAAEADSDHPPQRPEVRSAGLRELRRSSYLSLVPIFGWPLIRETLRRLGLEEP